MMALTTRQKSELAFLMKNIARKSLVTIWLLNSLQLQLMNMKTWMALMLLCVLGEMYQGKSKHKDFSNMVEEEVFLKLDIQAITF